MPPCGRQPSRKHGLSCAGERPPRKLEGRFAAGDGVEILGPDGAPFAKGIAGASSDDLRRRPRGLEAVHRDRLVLY